MVEQLIKIEWQEQGQVLNLQESRIQFLSY